MSHLSLQNAVFFVIPYMYIYKKECTVVKQIDWQRKKNQLKRVRYSSNKQIYRKMDYNLRCIQQQQQQQQ